MNENILLKRMGFATHKAVMASVIYQYGNTERTAKCSHCKESLTSYWIDDEDRLTGWSAWKSSTGTMCGGKK